MQLDFGLTPNMFNKSFIAYGRAGYVANGTTINALQNQMYLWKKPAQANFIHILCIGGGGGGGAGRGANSGTTMNGAGGGAGASYTSQIYPAFLFPNEVWLAPGDGGQGAAGTSGSGNTAGGNGGISYVLLRNDSIDPSMQVQISGGSGAANDSEAPGGNPASGSTVTDVSGGGIVTTAGMLWGFTNGLVKTAVIGNAGGAGKGGGGAQTGVNSTAMSSLTNYICGGGASGGGSTSGNVSAAGGNVVFTSTIPYNGSIPGGALGSGASSVGGTGGNGICGWLQPGMGMNGTIPFFSTGGAGGGGATGTSSVGGSGGAGGIGSGGGGGGSANNTSSSGGNGGPGGPGAIIITYW